MAEGEGVRRRRLNKHTYSLWQTMLLLLSGPQTLCTCQGEDSAFPGLYISPSCCGSGRLACRQWSAAVRCAARCACSASCSSPATSPFISFSNKVRPEGAQTRQSEPLMPPHICTAALDTSADWGVPRAVPQTNCTDTHADKTHGRSSSPAGRQGCSSRHPTRLHFLLNASDCSPWGSLRASCKEERRAGCSSGRRLPTGCSAATIQGISCCHCGRTSCAGSAPSMAARHTSSASPLRCPLLPSSLCKAGLHHIA